MSAIILVIHLLIALAMIGVILLQKSEGGGLGMSGGGMSGFMTGRSTANLLTRTTAILAACFFVTSIALAFLSGHQGTPRSIIESAPTQTPAAPVAPAEPAAPSVPLSK
jgi:preprotein translocase subunit SecG